MHALAATEKHGDINAYAAATGQKRPTVQREVQAARVAKSSSVNFSDLLHRTVHVAEIHAAPESCWPPLVFSQSLSSPANSSYQLAEPTKTSRSLNRWSPTVMVVYSLGRTNPAASSRWRIDDAVSLWPSSVTWQIQ
jgi:hypothetical protein